MYFSRNAVGSVVNNTLPMAETSHEMKSATCGKASDISLSKSFSCAPSLTQSHTQYTTLSLEMPESANVHSTKQVSDFTENISAQINALLEAADVSTYQPQSFTSFSPLLGIYSHLRTKLSQEAMSKIEGLIALYGALISTSNYTGFISVLTLYAKTHSQESLISQLTDISKKLFDEMAPQSSERPEWLTEMSKALTDWKLLINSPSFAKISRVLSLLVTLGVTEKFSFTLGNFEIFAVEAMQKQANAIDLIDAVIETVVFFAEGAYMCFVSGSLKPLLFSTNEIVKLEEAYISLNTDWEYVRNGNLQKFTGKDESQFDKELSDTIEHLGLLYKTMPNGTEKKIVQQKWEKLSTMKSEFTATRVTGGLRKSPYTIKIYGNSGVGKSTLADLTMAASLKAIDVPSDPSYIVTLNEKEKYMSTYRSFVTGIKIDDYGNSKSEFWEAAPSDWIITICNNIRQAAIMADLANKGKVTIEPRCLTITTNVKSLHAGSTSNNPMSVLRRAHMHITVYVRPEFLTDNMLDSQKVLDKFGTLDAINDIWLIDVEKPIGDGPGKQNFSSWEIVHKQINIYQYLDLVVENSIKHNIQQESIVSSFKDPSKLINICPNCNRMTTSCKCEMEPHFGERIASVISTKAATATLNLRKLKLSAETKVEDFTVDALLTGYTKFQESPYSVWTNYIPEQFMDNDYVKAGILYFGQDYIGQSVTRYVMNFALFTLLFAGFATSISQKLGCLVLILCALYFSTCYAGVVEAKKNAYIEEIHKRRGVLNKLFISARDKHVHYACGAFASLALLYGACQVVKALRTSLSMQGSLSPSSIADIQNRDKEQSPWSREAPEKQTATSSFPTTDMANDRVMKSLGQLFIDNKFTGAFGINTNVLILPWHFLPTETKEAKFVLGKRTIRFILNPDLAQRVGQADLCLIYVPNTGPLKNTTTYFNTEHISRPVVANVSGLDPKGQPFSSRILWQYTPGVNNGPYVFNGAYYNLTKMNTFAGMCMSPIISEDIRKTILGFHIGGVTGTPKGCGVAVLDSELNYAMAALHQKSMTFVKGPQASELEDVVAGVPIVTSKEVHKNCPTNYIKEDGAVEIYGSVIGRKSVTSRVIQTPISDIVEEVCGVPNQWGPPQFEHPLVRADGHIDQQRWMPWYKSLDVCSQPSIGFDPVPVESAMKDYLAELRECYDAQEELWRVDLAPLSRTAIVSGIDGKRFIESMNSGTSMGFPFNCPKTGYLIDLEPTPGNACPRTFTDEIWQLVDELVVRADDEVFLNQIFGAALKDEPTKLTKDKQRVFQAAPIALQILIRKYFLPIARFLSANPLIAECAVGINSHGTEWHELSQHMSKFGDDRVIAGDYAKYDLRMPEQLTLSAFSVMLEIAKWSGNYTYQDLKIMRVVAHDVCSPLVAFNGTLIRFMGTNPSGQNMTVYLNSIVNSLLHRLAFQDCYGPQELVQIGEELGLGRPARFRDLCAISTYGDDAKGSVRKGYDKFNHVSMANFLARNDIVFTMPDKESAPVPFMSRYEADFLKRQDRLDPELGVVVGALDETSIFKSLHSILKSKVVSPIEVCTMNIDGALREWFYHGPEVYEKRREQMKEVASKANLPVPSLDIDYQERVAIWKEKYQPQSGEIPASISTKSPPEWLVDWCANLEKEPQRELNSLKKTLKNNKCLSEAGTQKLNEKIEYLENVLQNTHMDTSCQESVISELTHRSSASTATTKTYQTVEPKAVTTEATLIERAKEVLGKPTAENFQFGLGLGEMDLYYATPEVALVCECKRVIRKGSWMPKVKKQANKYANAIKILRPELTVYAIVYTEYGFTILDCLGEPKHPERFRDFLLHCAWE